jgi:chromosome segregation ATPase
LFHHLEESQKKFDHVAQEKAKMAEIHSTVIQDAEKAHHELIERISSLQTSLENEHAKFEELKLNLDETKKIVVDQNSQINSMGEQIEQKMEQLSTLESFHRELEEVCEA